MKNKQPRICPCCGYWRQKGQVSHSPSCKVLELETIGKRQTKSEKQYQQRKKQEMVEHYYRKKRVRPLSVNPANKAKSHPHSNWPPIISGGAVESNRRRH